jgi:predicted polyphosphate/ATP-dependent NAD kinase
MRSYTSAMRIGFLINPIAGMGGRVGLKGTDGVLEKAVALGAEPVAPGRAEQMLGQLRQALDREKLPCVIEWLTCSGKMGEQALRAFGFDDIEVVHQTSAKPSANDTTAAAHAFIQAKADLVVFCGGDGTARDIVAITKDNVPVLGIPSGVKMYSGVFGITVAKTADIIVCFLRGEIPIATVDVVDLDEERYRQGEWAVRLHHTALTPFEPTRTQLAKALIAESSDAAVKAEIAEELCELIRTDSDRLYLLGPGSTIRAVAEGLGVDKTLLGIDALVAGRLVGHDLNETGLWALLERYQEASLIVSPIGAQGFVLGRGNLQISPKIVRRIGIDNILVVATPAKIARTTTLRFDTGDSALDSAFQEKGYISVVTGFRRRRLVPVSQ